MLSHLTALPRMREPLPASGVTHNDEPLWDIVAFLRQLLQLTADQ
jgi:hypothetical protein